MAPLPSSRSHPPPARSSSPIAAAAFIVLVLVLLLGGPSSVSAQTETDETPADTGADAGADAEADPAAAAEAELVREGQQVYSQICSSCHQPGGTGLAGQFPPLLDNPNVDDAAYVADVITNGLQGEITVLGETYNGVMPSFSTLTDDEVAGVIAFIQADFEAPAAEEEAFAESTGPVAGTELPALTNMGSLVAYALAAAVILLVLAPRLLSANDRLSVPWLDAWLKTASILLAVFLLVIYIPNWALQQGAVARLSRFGQDVIGTGLWTIGLVALLGGLWYAHRESRV
jgi:mono/diheme cytochrome c family protein